MKDRVEFDAVGVRWDRAVWPEGDVEGAPIVFLFEFNSAGGVLRQVELAGLDETPIAAASLAEFWQAQGYTRQAATPALVAYETRFGRVAEGTLGDWAEDYPGVQISREEFDRVWRRARDHLATK